MIGGIFHIWFGAFIGKQTMKTRAVGVCNIMSFVEYHNSSAYIYFCTRSQLLLPMTPTSQVFTKDSFELRSVTNKHLGIQADKGLVSKERKNYVLGTDNKWKYNTFVNWDFFPSMNLPILVYFKETQTPKVSQTAIKRTVK